MAGIYIHIPFCRKACNYCDFHFSTSLKYKDRMLSAIQLELEQRSTELTKEIRSIYFGGGTPSLLNLSELSTLLSTIYAKYQVAENCEITLEANPDDVVLDLFSDYKSIGVNRISIGIQSFRDVDLKYLGRIHSKDQAHKSLSVIKNAGFDNITADLIYGIPGASAHDVLENLKILFEYDIPHVSAYALTIEEKTALSHLIANSKAEEVNPDEQNRQFYSLKDFLESNSFEHYELSNYAKSDYKSIHNSNYWNRIAYLGIGPSAHGFQGAKRRWNISNNALFMQGVELGESYWETEILSDASVYNEKILVGLRRKEGISVSDLKPFDSYFADAALAFIEKGWLEHKHERYFATRKGLIWLDKMSENLFFTD